MKLIHVYFTYFVLTVQRHNTTIRFYCTLNRLYLDHIIFRILDFKMVFIVYTIKLKLRVYQIDANSL